MTLRDLRVYAGKADRPVVVLVHGFGMTGHFWSEPHRCRVLGGLAPVTVFLNEPPAPTQPGHYSTGRPAADVRGLGLRLLDAGFGVVSWSQADPLGPIGRAVDELAELMGMVGVRFGGRPVVLVGHSRGGLVARLYLQRVGTPGPVAGLVTLSSPHGGTRLAEYSRFLQPLGLFLKKILPTTSAGRVAQAMSRMAHFLASPAIEELTPTSAVIESLAGVPAPVPSLSIGGTDPGLGTFYVRLRVDQPWHPYSLADIVARLVPGDRLPPELVAGRGDGLVTAASSILEGGEHADFPVNHVAAAFDRSIAMTVCRFLDRAFVISS